MSLSQQVYEQLRGDLRAQRFGINAFINESTLTQRYGVGKAPVRDALRRLRSEGLLVSHPRKGYLIAALTPQEMAHVQKMRLMCEGYGLQLALGASPEALAALMALAQAPLSLENNAAFHRSLASLGGSGVLAETVTRLMTASEHALGQMLEEKGEGVHPPHVAMVKGLGSGDLAAALAALEDDIRWGWAETANVG